MRAGIDLPAPPQEAPRDEGGSGWVPLTRAADDIDAHLLTGRMAEAGVDTWLLKDRGAPGAWMYGGSNPWAPVTIMVRRIEYEAARVVLAEIAYEAPAADPAEARPARRPSGGPLAWWAAAIALGILFTIAGLVRTSQLLSP